MKRVRKRFSNLRSRIKVRRRNRKVPEILRNLVNFESVTVEGVFHDDGIVARERSETVVHAAGDETLHQPVSVQRGMVRPPVFKREEIQTRQDDISV